MNEKSRKEQIISLLEANPLDSFLLFALAKELEKEANWPEAKNTYETLYHNDEGYIALYYHFGKLLERLLQKEQAALIYQKGITKCLESNDLHTKSELQSALMNLEIE